MDNIYDYIIGGLLTVIPILLFVTKLFAVEYITRLVKTIFKSKSDKSALFIFYSIITILFVIGILITLNSIQKQDKPDDKVVEEVYHPKSDAEVILEGTELGIELIKEGVEKRQKKNEEIIKNRGKRLVYQIGDIKDNEESVLNLYKKLKSIPSIDFSRIFVFEISKNKYVIYKNDEYSEKQINDSLISFKAQIANIEPLVEIFDLMENCKVKESITETKSLKFRKEKIEIPCYNCDK